MNQYVRLHILLPVLLLIASCSQSPVAPVPGPGSSWSVFAISDGFTSVSGSANTDVYVLGVSGSLLHYDGMGWSASMPLDNSLLWTTLWCASPHDVFAVGYSRVFSGGGWQYDYRVHRFDGSVASPTNLSLPIAIHDLWGSSGSDVYAIGGRGLILHYDGSNWQPMESGTTSDILAVWGFPSGELVAVLEHSVLYCDGTSWREILATSETLWDIWGSSPEDVYAVGANGTVMHYNGESWALTRLPYGPDLEIVFGLGPNDVYVSGEHDATYRFDGASWSSSLCCGMGFESFWGSSGNDVYAVGYGDDDDRPFPSIRHFDGAAWMAQASDYSLPLRANLTAIAGNERELYVGGKEHPALFRRDGTSWKLMWRTDTGQIADIWAGPGHALIALTNEGYAIYSDESGRRDAGYVPGPWSDYTDVWATGLNDRFYVGAAGHIAHFDGNAYEIMESTTAADLNDVWGRSGTEVYAVGNSGTVLRYDGKSWLPMQSNTSENIEAIWGNAETAVAVGANGAILHCIDGRWEPMNSPSAEILTGVWGAASNDIYAAGARGVLHYDGSRWEILSDTLGGTQIWGRVGDGVYLLGIGGEGRVGGILRYGPTPS